MLESIIAQQPKKKGTEPRRVSLDVYFRAEEKSIEKHEYHNGIILKMAGGTFNHDNIASKCVTFINIYVEENDLNFLVNSSETKIRIDTYDKVVYADALVVCDQPNYFNNRKDTITNPIVIIEALSDSTKNYDKTTKFEMYRSLQSFKEYVLIHQDRKHVSIYTKQNDATWILRDYDGDDAIAILYHLHNCPLSLKRLYRGLVL